MTESKTCPMCGAVVPASAPSGICPKCLMRAALEGGERSQAAGGGITATAPQTGGFAPPHPSELAPHFPQLEISELLGHGGMGAVYKARQTKLDRLAALKIIRPEAADDPAFTQRFNREARTLARLNHPHIVAVYDFGEVTLAEPDGEDPQARTLYYFLMEYVDGANLRHLIQSGELTSDEALAIIPQICEALQFAHDEGIVHRDIKPENVLLDRRGRVKIADFGLAKLASRSAQDHTLTGAHQVMGTPRYMAPEQMESAHAVDHRADIYSLGVVFYEMLTGQVPAGHFDPPSKKVRVDVRLDEVVLRSLAREPDRRYQHASEVKTDVESISQSGAKRENDVRQFSAAAKPEKIPDDSWASSWRQKKPAVSTTPRFGARSQVVGPILLVLGALAGLLALAGLAIGTFWLLWSDSGTMRAEAPLAGIEAGGETSIFTHETYAKIQPEMTDWQLIDMLGPPDMRQELPLTEGVKELYHLPTTAGDSDLKNPSQQSEYEEMVWQSDRFVKSMQQHIAVLLKDGQVIARRQHAIE